jgi:hypothetical protein
MQRETRRAAREAQFRAEEAPIITDLASAGVSADSVGNFVGKRAAPPDAIPVLIRHLGLWYSHQVSDTIIRAVGVPWARAAAFEMFCASFRAEVYQNLRFAIANSLSGMARFDELRELPDIQEYGVIFSPNHTLQQMVGADRLSTDQRSSGLRRC